LDNRYWLRDKCQRTYKIVLQHFSRLVSSGIQKRERVGGNLSVEDFFEILTELQKSLDNEEDAESACSLAINKLHQKNIEVSKWHLSEIKTRIEKIISKLKKAGNGNEKDINNCCKKIITVLTTFLKLLEMWFNQIRLHNIYLSIW
jgi:hypothetical protein